MKQIIFVFLLAILAASTKATAQLLDPTPVRRAQIGLTWSSGQGSIPQEFSFTSGRTEGVEVEYLHKFPSGLQIGGLYGFEQSTPDAEVQPARRQSAIRASIGYQVELPKRFGLHSTLQPGWMVDHGSGTLWSVWTARAGINLPLPLRTTARTGVQMRFVSSVEPVFGWYAGLFF